MHLSHVGNSTVKKKPVGIVLLALLLIPAFSATQARAESMAQCLAGLYWPICGDWCLNAIDFEDGLLFDTVTCNLTAVHPSGANWSESCVEVGPGPAAAAAVDACSSACDNYYQQCPDPPPPDCPEPPPAHGPKEKITSIGGASLLTELQSLEEGGLRLVNGVLLWRADPRYSNGQEGLFAVSMEDVGDVRVSEIPVRIAKSFNADIWRHSDSLNVYTLIGEEITVRLRKTLVDWAWPDADRPELPLTVEVEVFPALLSAEPGELVFSAAQ